MPLAELGGHLSFVLGILIALIGVIYRNDQKQYENWKKDADAKIQQLESQNLSQETRIATLIANAGAHSASMDRLATSIEKLDAKIDEFNTVLLQYMGRRPSPFPGKKDT